MKIKYLPSRTTIQRLIQPRKRTLTIILSVMALVLGCAVFFLSSKPEQTTSKGRTKLETLKSVPFTTVLPKNASIDKLGGWRRVSPPGTELVVAYSDTIDSVPVTVSQQLAPRAFSSNSDKFVALAKKFNATDKLSTKNATTYIGTSANGPQSVVVIKNDLLVSIRSKTKIEDSSWIRYIESLE